MLLFLCLYLVKSHVIYWDILCPIARVSKSIIKITISRSPLTVCYSLSHMMFSTKWCFHSLCGKHSVSHTFSHMHVPHTSCFQNFFINFLFCTSLLECSVLETYKILTTSASLRHTLVQTPSYSLAILSYLLL